MSQNTSCKEKFLDDIIEISVYPTADCTIPMPFAVPNISQLNNVRLPATPSLHVSYAEDSEVMATEGSISAKQTSSRQGSGIVYAHELSANIEEGIEKAQDAYINIVNKDCVAVLRRIDGSLLLVYSLPHTFDISVSISEGKTRQMQLKLSSKSASPFIDITPAQQ